MKTLLALGAVLRCLRHYRRMSTHNLRNMTSSPGIVMFDNVIEMGTMKMKHKVMSFYDYGMRNALNQLTDGEKLDNSL